MSTNPVSVATIAQTSLIPEGEDEFRMEKCVVFAYCADGLRVLMTASDIYDALMDLPYEATLHSYEEGIGIVTTGWASPLPEDGSDPSVAPSAHPARQRVRLSTVITRDGKMGSAICFQEKPDEMVTDEGGCHGSLADALMTAMEEMGEAS